MVFTEINDDDDDDNDTEYSVLVLPYCHLAKQKYNVLTVTKNNTASKATAPDFIHCELPAATL